MRTYGVDQVFRFVEGSYVDRGVKADIFSEKDLFTSYVRNIFWAAILYKSNGEQH